MLYWPAFEFHYELQMRRLLPHIAVIEASQAAFRAGILPPQWRPQASHADARAQNDACPEAYSLEEIRQRKQQLMANNASRAQGWVRARFAPCSSAMSLNDIVTMHRLVAQESGIRYTGSGQLRKEGLQVVVGDDEIGYHKGAPPEKLTELMQQYTQFLYRRDLVEMPAIVHALIAHFFFTTIHPFEDGNGRVSRLVSAAILFQRGYNGHGFYALANYFYENERRYHSLVHRTQRGLVFDLTDFVAFGMEGLARELEGTNNFLKFKVNRAVRRQQPPPKLRLYFCR
jgi:fido (protein-threonine AMPylation protein)